MATVRDPNSVRSIILRWSWNERFLLLGVAVVAVAISVVVNLSHPPMHSATVVVSLDEAFSTTDAVPDLRVTPSDGMRRLRHEVVSQSTLKRLADKHGLGVHYGLPDDLPHREANVIAKLRSRITVLYEDRTGLSITVADRDQQMAVWLAADLHRALAANLEERAAAHFKRVAGVYEKLGRDMALDVERERQLLSKLLLPAGEVPTTDSKLLEMVDVGARLSVANGELAQLRSAQRSASIMAGKEHLPRLFLIQEAMADPRPDPLWAGMFRTLLFVVVALILAIVARLAWSRNKHEVREMVQDWFEGPKEPLFDDDQPSSGPERHVKPKVVERRESMVS